MAKLIDLTGKKFGRLTVMERADNKSGRPAWHCVCECLNELVVIGSNLQAGNTTSCGCAHKEQAAETGKANAKAKPDTTLIEQCVAAYEQVQEDRSNVIRIEAYIAARKAMAQRGTR